VATLGTGILPSGAVGNELVAVTRRAFIPKVIVQLYKATPTLSALLAAAEPITGGVSPITVPLQGTAMVTTSTTDYSGSFTAPQVQTGLQNAEFNLKAMVTPIPFYVMEGLAQIDAAVIPLIEARMNDAGNSITDYLSTRLWNAISVNTALDIYSIADVIATTNPSQGNYGGISRTTNTFWQGNVKTASPTVISRNTVLQWITSAAKASGGEMPSFGIMGPGTWAALAQDYVGSERYVITPERAFDTATDGARAVFTALSVAGVPIYMDLYSGENQLVLFNTSYFGFKIHQDAAFAVAGPESLLPNFQLGYIMVLVALLETVCTKPAAQTIVTGFTGALSV
jgi:hypothetical protein